MIINFKIVSGGQSGVDRAALDFALQNGISCGGWCPKGRLAEDGSIDQKYPLKETQSSLYVVRTKLNVDDSDATLVLYSNELGKGTVLTAEYAQLKKKPLLMLNVCKSESIAFLQKWISENSFNVLNIAGPRESTSPGIYKTTLSFLEMAFC